MRALLTSDARYHEFGTERKIEGPEPDHRAVQGLEDCLPGCRRHRDKPVASGNTAVLEVTWKGTHTGPLVTAAGTIPASGKHQETPAAVFYAFEGGKIKASRHYFDVDDNAQADRRRAQVTKRRGTAGGRPLRRSVPSGGARSPSHARDSEVLVVSETSGVSQGRTNRKEFTMGFRRRARRRGTDRRRGYRCGGCAQPGQQRARAAAGR